MFLSIILETAQWIAFRRDKDRRTQEKSQLAIKAFGNFDYRKIVCSLFEKGVRKITDASGRIQAIIGSFCTQFNPSQSNHRSTINEVFKFFSILVAQFP